MLQLVNVNLPIKRVKKLKIKYFYYLCGEIIDLNYLKFKGGN